jgi:WD40 repeat protein
VVSGYDLFVSYVEADRAWVDGYLLEALGRAGVRCHREAAFTLGVPRVTEFENAVKNSRRTLLVLSPAYLADDTAGFVDLLAQQFGLETSTWPVIPLVLEPVALPTRLAMLTRLDATDLGTREAAIERLCAVFQRPAPPLPKRPPCPYPGMRAFVLYDEHPFFGRDRESEELLQCLRVHSFWALLGASASGKSSLVFAGLVPKLCASGRFGLGGWVVRVMRPGSDPLGELARALGADSSDLATAVARVVGDAPGAARLLLVVDQFEELFTTTKGDWDSLPDALMRLAEVPGAYVVVTARADFYAELMRLKAWPTIKAHAVDVQPLDEDNLRDAIRKPAERVGVYVEAALVERLTRDAAGEPGVLPLLQETLVQLWEKIERRHLPLRAYESLVLPRPAYDTADAGRKRTALEVAIALHANRTMGGLDAARQQVARRIFLRLIQFGEGRPHTRRQQAEEQVRKGIAHADFDAVVRHLTDSRLLTRSGDETTRRLDIAHEALIEGWPTLRRWIEDHRAGEELRRRIDGKFDEWVHRGRSDEGLLGPVALREAEQWLTGPDGQDVGPDDSLRGFLRASREALRRADEEKDRRIRRQRQLLAVLGACLVLAVAATAWAVRETWLARDSAGEARRQTAEVMTHAGALDLDAGRSFEAMHRFARAVEADDGAPARSANRRRLGRLAREAPRLEAILPHPGRVNDASFDRDGRRVVTASSDQAARVWEAGTGRLLTVLEGHSGPVKTARFSPDGTRVVSASYDGTVRVWDLTERRAVVVFQGVGKIAESAAFSPDGRLVAATGKLGNSMVWDTTSFQKVAEFEPGVLAMHKNTVAFSPDSRRIVVASNDGTSTVWGVAPPKDEPLSTLTVKDFSLPHEIDHRAFSAAFSPDGRRVVTSYYDGSVRVWLPVDGQGETLATLKGLPAQVATAAFDPSGERVVLSSPDGKVRVWHVGSSTSVYTLIDPTGQDLDEVNGHNGWVVSAVFSPDGSRVVTASHDGTARVWDVTARSPFEPLKGPSRPVYLAVFSPDGSRVLTASGDEPTKQVAQVWDAGGRLVSGLVHGWRVLSGAFSSDGRRVLTASGDRIVHVWESESGRCINRIKTDIPGEYYGHWSAAFSPDGTRAATTSDGGSVLVWDTMTGLFLYKFGTHEPDFSGAVLTATFSPDGSRIVAGYHGGNARVWQLAGKGAVGPTVIAELKGHQNSIYHAAFSPDGSCIVTASLDRTARLWDAATFEGRGVLRGHSDRVKSAAFHPDGTCLLTASDDGTVRIWECETSRTVATLARHTRHLASATFRPDGDALVTTSQNGGPALVWSVAPIPGDAAELPRWVEVVTGTVLEGGFVRALPLEEWERRRRAFAAGPSAGVIDAWLKPQSKRATLP